MEILQNFTLAKAKKELSPHIKHLPKVKGAINRAVQSVIKDIDSILLDTEGATTKEHLKSPRKYEALEVVLSYLVQEGYSQFKQEHISKKSGISKPLINYVIGLLMDLKVCHQIKVRRYGKLAPSIYILTLHNNYLKIVEYFKQKWAFAIEIYATFTEFLSKKIIKKQSPSIDKKKIDKANNTCNGLDYFTAEELKEENKHNDMTARIQDLNEYLSEDQQKAYFYIMGQHMTNLSEKEAFSIANRLPKQIDDVKRRLFEDSVLKYKYIKAEKSNVAHFMKTFEKEIKLYNQRKKEKAREEKMNRHKYSFDNPMYNWLETPEQNLLNNQKQPNYKPNILLYDWLKN
ncbi:Replicase RepFR55 [Bacillus paranthracis]|uniref:Replicase RepFR55 n=1 Tax=Bacillus paranthracis TaxID=2026186 RepID=A0A5M9GK97_9BACI|nr:Replicase RepFR55 [Bacillus paranthracis]KAA8473254.1 Replicase RepFR55 [Bacillus paranthracis]QPA42220.1 Replicase RepFR55 [Bacillus paranthracis]